MGRWDRGAESPGGAAEASSASSARIWTRPKPEAQARSPKCAAVGRVLGAVLARITTGIRMYCF